MRRRLLWLGMVTTVASVLVGCGDDAPPTPSDPVLAQGQAVYATNCASCHGLRGDGGYGPPLAGVMEERFPDIGGHIAVIAEGRPGTNMPAFKDRLTPEEIEAVARYEREALG